MKDERVLESLLGALAENETFLTEEIVTECFEIASKHQFDDDHTQARDRIRTVVTKFVDTLMDEDPT
jgi:hypothetical protein